MDKESLERAACTPVPLSRGVFNPNASLPYGCETAHIQQGMEDFLDFLGFINQQLNRRGIDRLESIMMQANFSSLVGEFMINAIAKAVRESGQKSASQRTPRSAPCWGVSRQCGFAWS